MNANERAAVVRQLQNSLQQMHRLGVNRGGAKSVSSTGIAVLDDLLPTEVFRSGIIVELVVDGAGCGAMRLAIPMMKEALRDGGTLVVIDDRREFYPPAAVRLGLDLDRTIVIRPHGREEIIWALEQSLRCPGVAATLGRIGHIHDRVFRRLQLAAEHGGGIGLLIRPAKALQTPTWADQRWLVVPLPGCSSLGGRLRVELLFCRGRTGGRAVELEINDETGDVRVAPPLAATASLHHAAGA